MPKNREILPPERLPRRLLSGLYYMSAESLSRGESPPLVAKSKPPVPESPWDASLYDL